MSGTSRERSEEVSSLGKKSDGALQKITNKLSDVRNVKDLHLKHYHMSSAQFKKRTTHLDIPGKVYDLYQQVVKTCPFCKSTKPRPDRSRVSGQSRIIWRSHLLGSWLCKYWRQTFGFLIVLDGATSHLTAYPCNSTSPSEVISKLREWVDTLQMNPRAICADMAFHHPHDMQAFYRMQNIQRFPTGPYTPWPIRAEMGVRSSKNLDKTSVTNHTCSVDAQGSDGEKHAGDSEWQNAYGVSHGKETKRSHGPSFHESRTADIYTQPNRTFSMRKFKNLIGYENTSRNPTTRRHSTGSC